MIVTIDGPAGAGKSSAARLLAQRLGWEYLDTGAMYRAVTLAGVRAGVDLNDQPALGRLLETLRLELPAGKVLLNGADVTKEIRDVLITDRSGPVANSPVVRQRLVAWQRAFAQGRDMVCEGRDQGTIVFPDAPCKFFLSADPVERARRRHRQLLARGDAIALEEILEAQTARDRRDAARDIAPMVPAADAIVLDSTGMTVEEVVEFMCREVERRRA